MSKAIVIGEALIDFIPNTKGLALQDVDVFCKKPGGAPANVAASIAALGGKISFITQLGEDVFGRHILHVLKERGVDCEYIFLTKQANTALAFVSLASNGERDFSFYRNPCADLLLEEDKIEKEWFEEGDIFHFGSVDLVPSPMKKSHDRCIAYAKEQGCLISFDPNVRFQLWESKMQCIDTIRSYIEYADILKISDEELAVITGIEEEESALSWLREKVGILLYTLGKDGARVIGKGLDITCRGIEVDAKDTTGAGDSFMGTLLFQLLSMGADKDSLLQIGTQQWERILDTCNKAAAIVVGREGAISAMPTLEELR